MHFSEKVPLLDKVPVTKKSKHYSNAHRRVVQPFWSAELKGQETGWQNGYFKRKNGFLMLNKL
jgi:hypothetical protein